jgi:hypothetical protein
MLLGKMFSQDSPIGLGCLDSFPTVTRFSQYQSSPGPVHFEALHNILLYLRHKPDGGLTFTRSCAVLPLVHDRHLAPTVVSISFDMSLYQVDGLGDPIGLTHEPVDSGSEYHYDGLDTMSVPRVSLVGCAAPSSMPPACTSDLLRLS